MSRKTSKFITILIAYVFLFSAPLCLNASISNNLLSIIQAERSHDYYSWNELDPNKNSDGLMDGYIIKKIIVKDWDLNKVNSKSSNFLNITLNGLINLDKKQCGDIAFDNQNLQSFENAFLQAFNAWQIQCKNKKITKKSQINFDNNLKAIDPNFSNFIDFNKLSYFYFNQKRDEFINLYSQINFENSQFISINLRKIIFLKKILIEYDIDSSNLELFINKYFALLGDQRVDQYYKILSYKQLIFEQAYQLSNYYKTLEQYENSLAILSVLSELDPDNKDHYLINKYQIMLSLTKNQKVFNLLNTFNSELEILNFMKHKLFLEYASSFNMNKEDVINYYNSLNNILDPDLQLNLAFEVSSFLYASEGLEQSISFLENCCFKMIHETQSIEYIFRYGALLEESKRTSEAEEFILKSIEYSGDNPSPIILNYLAYLWIEMDKNFETAENMLVKAISETEANNGAILDSLGWLYFKKNNFDIAEKWIHSAYLLEPAEPEIIDHLSQIYKEQGRNKEAQYLDAKILNFHKDYFKFKEVLNRNYEN